MSTKSRAAIGWAALLACLLIPAITLAQLNPSLQKAFDWLSTRIQATAVTGEESAVGTALQTRAEAVHALKALGSLPAPLAQAVADPSGGDGTPDTETLARRVLAGSWAGQDMSGQVQRLRGRQNSDGGFGGGEGYQSHALDTAWAVIALAEAGQGAEAPAANARRYLAAQLSADGGVGAASANSAAAADQRLYSSALASLALQSSADPVSAQAVSRLTQYMAAQQGADGGWQGDTLITSWVLQAVAPVSSDAGLRTAAAGFLQARQASDGSWGADPYITAVALRALGSRSNPAPAPGSIAGVVIDANSGGGLEGVTVALSGGSLSAVTDSLGAYRITGVGAGSYTVAFSRPGYQSASLAASISASQSLGLGQTSLRPNPTTGIVRGLVTAQSDGRALAGVTISLTGATPLSAQTDSSGRFEFSAVPQGAVTLSAALPGYRSASGTASVAAGQTLVFSPVLAKDGETGATNGELFGRVVKAAGGSPLVAAQITVTNLATGAVLHAAPGVDGRFSATLQPASYLARYALAGFKPVEQRFMMTAGARVDAGVVALTAIQTASTVSGKVLDTNGAPIAGATVSVVGGPATSTQALADGSYRITDAGTTTVTLRASAVGHDAQVVTLQSEQPTDLVYTFNLPAQSSGGAAVSQLSIAPGSVPADADLTGSATVVASGQAPVQFVAQYQVRDAQGGTIGSGAATVGGNPLGSVTLQPGAERSFQLRWNAGQFAPGNYSLVVRLVEPGSQSTANPNGAVLAERAASFTITGTSRLVGSVTAHPPVLRAGTNTPVTLSARLQNGGNIELAPDSYKLSIRNAKTNVEVQAIARNGPALSVNGLASLDFGTWTPGEAGDYRLELTSSDAARGVVAGKLYVGDAGSATFKVDRPVVPTGTQRVRASVDVRGQDVANGTISDPLVPQVKAAIGKAVNYADNFAYNHYLNDLKCYACHVQTQAIVGGERNLKFLKPLDPLKRSVLMSGITQFVIDEGSIPYSGYLHKTTNTTLGLWATEEWHGKEALGLSRYKMAKYLMGVQQSDGGWGSDHAAAWWQTSAPYVGLNTGSLAAVARWISGTVAPQVDVPRLVAAGDLPSLPGGDMRLAAADDGTLYIAHQTAGKVWKVAPDGASTVIIDNLAVQGVRPISGDRLLVAARSGVYLREAGGALNKISSIDSWDAIALADGSFMVSPWGGRTIQKLAADGNATPYFDSDLFASSSGTINQLADGSFLVHGHAGQRLVRFNAQGLVNVPIAMTDGRPLDAILHDGGVLVATESGLFFFNSDWVGERWYSGRVMGLVRMPDGRLLVNAGSQLMEVRKDRADLAALKSQIDVSIARSTDWLVAGHGVNSSSNIDLAFRLYGLGQARSYNPTGPKAAGVEQAISAVAAQLRGRQRADGGWVWREGTDSASDPMVTAMVGIALDVLNPSPESPEVRKAVELLLARQQPDGTWVTANGIAPGVPLLTSTWVEIWLPVMLDRLGGIDTLLTVELPANAQPAGFSLAPSTSTPLDGGGLRLTWKLDGVTSAGRALEFDLDMPGLVPNEVRRAATRAYLTFNNTFTEQPVDLDIAVPTVTATAGLGASVTTDRRTYGPDTPVQISASVINNALLAQKASVALKIVAPDGQPVADLGVFDVEQLAEGGTHAVSAVWSTAQWLAGDGYRVQARLMDAEGRTVSDSEASFAIAAPLGRGVSARILTDKAHYAPNETLALTDRLVNEAPNTVLDSLQARTTVRHAGGALLWETTQPLAQLVGGAFKELGYRVPLGAAAAGRYTATLTVLDSQGQALASTAASFDVLDTAVSGAGLSGTLQVLGSPVPAGDAAAVHWSVSNKGNNALAALPLVVRIVDPAAGLEVARLPMTTLDVAAGATSPYSQSWITDAALQDKTLVAVLTAQVGPLIVDLAQGSFAVGKPPVKLDVSQQGKAGTGGVGRVLVLYDCEPDLGWDLLGWLRLSYTHSCYKDRRQYLANYLGAMKVPHYITYDRQAFRKELRSGAYNSIWMLGALPDCGAHLLNEVREAVNRGATLLVDGGATAYENHALFRLAGARYGGHIWLSSKTMDVVGSFYTPARLGTVGLPLRLSLTGGSVQASYAAQYCYRVDYDGEDASPHPGGKAYPAVVSSGYGRGKAVAFGFDLVGALRHAGADASAWKRLVGETLTYLTPPDEQRTLVAGEYAVWGTQISNQGSAAVVETQLSLPAAAQIVGAMPQVVLESGNKVLWSTSVATGSTVNLQAAMRAPLTAGSYSIGTEVAVVRNGQRHPYASYSGSFTVQDSLAPAKAALQRLHGLNVPLVEALTLLSAKVDLDYGLKLYQQGRWHDAIEELGEATSAVRLIGSTDLSAERLAIDRLMQDAQYRWYLQQPK